MKRLGVDLGDAGVRGTRADPELTTRSNIQVYGGSFRALDEVCIDVVRGRIGGSCGGGSPLLLNGESGNKGAREHKLEEYAGGGFGR